KAVKSVRPDTMIAVGGCIGQRDGLRLLRVLPHVDVVFGTHNISRLPELLTRALTQNAPVVEVLDSSAKFTSDLPSRREHSWHAWVPITVGCDNHCTYCIVPYVRGPERSRPIDDVVRECETLVAGGVLEITLLGQNVNSYGRDLYGEPRFSEILRQVAQTGPARVRFATSHPKDLSQDTIAVMASMTEVCKALHLPVQAGSNRILEAMNRRYTQAEYLALVSRLYEAIPGLALSTDIIVGFPGETEADFQETLRVIREARYDQAFTFIYSPRKGTPAARMDGRVPREVVQERFDRLVSEVQAQAIAKNEALIGTVQTVLVEGPSKRDAAVIAGRTDGNKVIHAPTEGDRDARDLAGEFVDVEVLEAHTWFLAGRIVDR
ncbi:MAG: tRNA (N6-isopentenyl adenosine(37)-C2)-methylthiotransferase MiaB, partial [Coriobacteriia bacterium]|nr:tRNA (N6-isopentenyl adenosine(37)-C2)-methylthiotransferase MiaB [Coriobacteriia bacterium]